MTRLVRRLGPVRSGLLVLVGMLAIWLAYAVLARATLWRALDAMSRQAAVSVHQADPSSWFPGQAAITPLVVDVRTTDKNCRISVDRIDATFDVATLITDRVVIRELTGTAANVDCLERDATEQVNVEARSFDATGLPIRGAAYAGVASFLTPKPERVFIERGHLDVEQVSVGALRLQGKMALAATGLSVASTQRSISGLTVSFDETSILIRDGAGRVASRGGLGGELSWSWGTLTPESRLSATLDTVRYDAGTFSITSEQPLKARLVAAPDKRNVDSRHQREMLVELETSQAEIGYASRNIDFSDMTITARGAARALRAPELRELRVSAKSAGKSVSVVLESVTPSPAAAAHSTPVRVKGADAGLLLRLARLDDLPPWVASKFEQQPYQLRCTATWSDEALRLTDIRMDRGAMTVRGHLTLPRQMGSTEGALLMTYGGLSVGILPSDGEVIVPAPPGWLQ